MTNLRKSDLVSLLLCVVLYGGFYFAIEEGLIPTLWSLHILAVLINIILVVSLNLINGFTGSGKTHFGCALGKEACGHIYRTIYIRTPELLETLNLT